MSDLKKAAVTRAINTLASVGAIYTVVFEGETVTNAPVIEKKRKAYVKSGVNYKPMYQAAIDHLKNNGDYYELPVPEGVDIAMLRGALAGRLSTEFGNSATITKMHRDKNVIEIVKV